jgi:predicted pyridoxine 5'-phosphate oxidase superfamily flavin-nucleotide-binding protein
MTATTTDVAFSASVKSVQTRRGSRAAYARLEQRGGWESTVTPELAAFLAERDSFYLATASADGRPYVQHRGGPRGFLRVLDERTLAFADFRGNRQYLTLGNLAENDRAFLFLMDYARRRRIKLWGRARVVEDDPALLERLADPAHPGRPEQAIVFTIEAWDTNCPQHIPQRFDAADVGAALERLEARIRALEGENRALRERLAGALVTRESDAPRRHEGGATVPPARPE